MSDLFSLLTLAAAIRLSIPYVLASLGGVTSERSGVVNIALEGILLTGAFAAAAAGWASGSALVGVGAALVAGVLVALFFALFAVWLGVDQIIAGLAINLMAIGGTQVGASLIWGKTHSDELPRLPYLWPPPASGDGAGELLHTLFAHPMVLLSFALVVAIATLHARTVIGLRWRAVGESASTTASLGISVATLRTKAVALSGALAGLGGAWLAFDVSQFSEGMSAGKGYIAMAAVVFGRWHPLGAALACLLFGSCNAMAESLERSGAPIPGQLLSALPYALTILVLAGATGRARAPADLGKHWRG